MKSSASKLMETILGRHQWQQGDDKRATKIWCPYSLEDEDLQEALVELRRQGYSISTRLPTWWELLTGKARWYDHCSVASRSGYARCLLTVQDPAAQAERQSAAA